MATKYLIVVDMQVDFVSGSLGTKEAQEIVDKVYDKVNSFKGEVVFTQDTHTSNYLDTLEGKNLPVKHCIKGTDGWKIVPKLHELIVKKFIPVIEKPTFGSVDLANTIKKIHMASGIESIEVIGLCTDICVLSNATLLKAFVPEVPLYVDSSCCAGTSPKSHQEALDVMKSIQIDII